MIKKITFLIGLCATTALLCSDPSQALDGLNCLMQVAAQEKEALRQAADDERERTASCGKTFSTLALKQQHEQKHRKVCCPRPDCTASFTQLRNLKPHISSLHEGVSYICPVCGEKIAQKNHIIRHIKETHLRKRHTCPATDKQGRACGKEFSQLSQIKKHLKSCAHKCNPAEIDELMKQIPELTYTEQDRATLKDLATRIRSVENHE